MSRRPAEVAGAIAEGAFLGVVAWAFLSWPRDWTLPAILQRRAFRRQLDNSADGIRAAMGRHPAARRRPADADALELRVTVNDGGSAHGLEVYRSRLDMAAIVLPLSERDPDGWVDLVPGLGPGVGLRVELRRLPNG